jgi:hypothetical protein
MPEASATNVRLLMWPIDDLTHSSTSNTAADLKRFECWDHVNGSNNHLLLQITGLSTVQCSAYRS